jgi:hypothetical protein
MLQVSIQLYMARGSTNRSRLLPPTPKNLPSMAVKQHSAQAPARRYESQKDQDLDTQHAPSPTTKTSAASTSLRSKQNPLPPEVSARDLRYPTCQQASCQQASCQQASCQQASCQQASCQQASCPSDPQLIRRISTSSLILMMTQPESDDTAGRSRPPLSGPDANKLNMPPQPLSDTTAPDTAPRSRASILLLMDKLKVAERRQISRSYTENARPRPQVLLLTAPSQAVVNRSSDSGARRTPALAAPFDWSQRDSVLEERASGMTRETWLQRKHVAESYGGATRKSVKLGPTLGASIALNAVMAHGPGADVRMGLQHQESSGP